MQFAIIQKVACFIKSKINRKQEEKSVVFTNNKLICLFSANYKERKPKTNKVQALLLGGSY